MSYLDCLVFWKVFDMVEVGFLPVRHSHTDMEQTFSTTVRHLDKHDAITREDLHTVLAKGYNEKMPCQA